MKIKNYINSLEDKLISMFDKFVTEGYDKQEFDEYDFNPYKFDFDNNWQDYPYAW